MIGSVVKARRSVVTLDLSGLSSIDSSGIGALVSLCKRLSEQGGNVRAVGTHDQPLAVFRLLGLEGYFSPAATAAFALLEAA